MLLEGSCHCGAVRFSVESTTPYPFMRCYCSICRKTAGGGGYAINIMGETSTLKVKGRKNIQIYRVEAARTEEGKNKKGLSSNRRHFCKTCGSALWGWDPRWKQWIYPFASAIDTPLPVPPEHVHIMLDYKAPWVEVPRGAKHKRYGRYGEESIAGWHKKRSTTER